MFYDVFTEMALAMALLLADPHRDWRTLEELPLYRVSTFKTDETNWHKIVEVRCDPEFVQLPWPHYLYINAGPDFYVDGVILGSYLGYSGWTEQRMQRGYVGNNTWRAKIGDWDHKLTSDDVVYIRVWMTPKEGVKEP